MKEIKGKYLLVLIAMCGVIGASLGLTTNVTGVYITPVAEAFNVGKGTVSMTLTICNIVYSIGGILVAKMLNQKSYKKVALISAVLLTVFYGSDGTQHQYLDAVCLQRSQRSGCRHPGHRLCDYGHQ